MNFSGKDGYLTINKNKKLYLHIVLLKNKKISIFALENPPLINQIYLAIMI